MKVIVEEFNELLEMQKVLDADILRAKNLDLAQTYNKRIIAAQVELAEFANEIRFFKFWSNKSASEKEICLDEYVDILHFLLSALYSKGYRYENLSIVNEECDWEEAFANCMLAICGLSDLLNADPITSTDFGIAFRYYFKLGELAGFKWAEVVEAYKKKNAVNFERLKSGY